MPNAVKHLSGSDAPVAPVPESEINELEETLHAVQGDRSAAEASLRPSLPDLDFAFLHRVYRTSGALGVFVAWVLSEALGRAWALGWLVGAGLSLSILAMLEWGVRRFLTPERPSLRNLGLLTVGKLFGAVAVLGLAFLAAMRGWLNLIAVLLGFAMPHVVAGLKLAGLQLLRVLNDRR